MEDYGEENDTDKEVKEELTADMVEKNNIKTKGTSAMKI